MHSAFAAIARDAGARTLIALLAVVSLAGCMSVRRPSPDAIAHIRRVMIVTLEAAPIAVTPALMQALETGNGAVMSGPPAGPATGIGAIATIGLLYVLSVEWPERESRRAEAMTRLAEWSATKDPWTPEQVLAGDAAAILSRNARFEVTGERVAALPGVTARSPTWHMENWMRPRRDWYKRTGSVVDLADAARAGADAILEISAGPLEASKQHAVLQVAVKLIDAATGDVLGAGNCGDSAAAAPPEEIFLDQGRQFKRMYGTLSRVLLEECFQTLGLIREA